MSEATISFSDYDQVRALLGNRDEYLRQVRDSVGVDVVLRGDELRLKGNDDDIRRAVDVFTELREIVEKNGQLRDWEVRRALNGVQQATGTAAPAEPVLDGPAGQPPRFENGWSINLYENSKRIAPRTAGQREYVHALANNDLVFCAGPAGCGKTYLAVAMAINALRSERVRKIVLVRPAVEAGEKLGFLPGDILAKVNPYLRPLLDSLNDLLDFEQVKRYMESDIIEIVPLAFMRGRTLNDTFIILDEGQNTTTTQMKMFLTRMGENSQIVVTGDTTQIDLPHHIPSGLIDAMKRLETLEGVSVVRLTGADIVRHRLVREIVRLYDQDAAQPERAES